jgi:hypothetical protein
MVGIFVGIDEMKKGYKWYILVLKKAILSKDAFINESTKFTFHLELIEHKEDEERELRLRECFPFLMKKIQLQRRHKIDNIHSLTKTPIFCVATLALGL